MAEGIRPYTSESKDSKTIDEVIEENNLLCSQIDEALIALRGSIKAHDAATDMLFAVTNPEGRMLTAEELDE